MALQTKMHTFGFFIALVIAAVRAAENQDQDQLKLVGGRLKVLAAKLKDRTAQLAQKELELRKRESDLADKEAAFRSVFAQAAHGKVMLNVGGTTFHVGAATLQNQSLFFDGILTEGFVKDNSGAFWIDRDPSVFEVVLDYLRYGSVPDNLGDHMQTKLSIDADYYLLPALKEKIA